MDLMQPPGGLVGSRIHDARVPQPLERVDLACVNLSVTSRISADIDLRPAVGHGRDNTLLASCQEILAVLGGFLLLIFLDEMQRWYRPGGQSEFARWARRNFGLPLSL
jgi:hypothetical protein